jgi:predicted AAA+ superfamily ATPase
MAYFREKYDDLDIESILEPYNLWWNDSAFTTMEFERPVLLQLYGDLLSLKQIISVTGPRRIGKTTLLKQLVKKLIVEQSVDSKHIIYFSFDDPLINGSYRALTFFDDMIKWVQSCRKGQTVYFFLDEIQRYEKWELYLKKYYDLGFPFKFIVSGSASSPIFKKSRESLMGRVKEYHLQPFSFLEFVYFFGGNDSQLMEFVNTAVAFGRGLQNGVVQGPLKLEEDIFSKLSGYLNRYLVEGGFPEVWEFKDIVQKQHYLYENQIQKVIFEDLVLATEFRKPENLKRFYLSLIEQPGQEINLENVSGKIGVSRIMLHKYLPMLEMTDLVKSIPRFSQRPFKFRRGSVKCYLVDLALRNAILKLGDKLLEDSVMLGYYAENLVFNALRNFYGVLELSYCKDARGEVDFIVNLGGKRLIPVEVKYREEPVLPEMVKWFMNKHGQNTGIMVTKTINQSGMADNVLLVPLPVFLLFF